MISKTLLIDNEVQIIGGIEPFRDIGAIEELWKEVNNTIIMKISPPERALHTSVMVCLESK